MTKLSEELKDDIVSSMAAGIVERLGEKAQKEVLSEALKEALGSWEVHRAVDKAVEEVANREMSAYLQRPEVIERIRTESIAAVEKVLAAIPLALADVLLRSCMGYSQYGHNRSEVDFGRALRRYTGIPEVK